MKKAIGILLLLVVLAAGGYFGFKLLFPAEEKEAEQPAQEEVVTEVPPEEKTWKDSVVEMAAGAKKAAVEFYNVLITDKKRVPAENGGKEKTGKKEKPVDKKQSEAAARQEKETQAEDLIKQGNQSLLRKNYAEAGESFKNAAELAQSNEKKYRALRGRAMASKMLGQGEAECAFGKAMLEFASNDGEKANAYEAMGNGYENLQGYFDAVNAYQKASELYKAAGNTEMAWTTQVSCSKVMRRGLNDYVGASQSIGRAWEIVDKSTMEEGAKRDIKWMLCLEYADNCRLAGDRYGQLNWNREAVKYNPDWKQNAMMIERELKTQGVI